MTHRTHAASGLGLGTVRRIHRTDGASGQALPGIAGRIWQCLSHLQYAQSVWGAIHGALGQRYTEHQDRHGPQDTRGTERQDGHGAWDKWRVRAEEAVSELEAGDLIQKAH